MGGFFCIQKFNWNDSLLIFRRLVPRARIWHRYWHAGYKIINIMTALFLIAIAVFLYMLYVLIKPEKF